MEDRWICVCWKRLTCGWSIYPRVSSFPHTHIYLSIIYNITKFHRIIFFSRLASKMTVYSVLVFFLRLEIFPEDFSWRFFLKILLKILLKIFPEDNSWRSSLKIIPEDLSRRFFLFHLMLISLIANFNMINC